MEWLMNKGPLIIDQGETDNHLSKPLSTCFTVDIDAQDLNSGVESSHFLLKYVEVYDGKIDVYLEI